MKSEVGVRFSYKDSNGAKQTLTAQVPITPNPDLGYAEHSIRLRDSSLTEDVVDEALIGNHYLFLTAGSMCVWT